MEPGPGVAVRAAGTKAERQMMRSRDPEARNDAEGRGRLRGLLTLRRVEGEPAGMSTFALLYPSPTLAELGDPLAIARDLGAAAHRSSGT
jgi:hypothetical protein